MKKLLSALLCGLMLLACGCSASYMNSSDGDIIPPLQDSVGASSSVLPLYFRYYNEPMLVRSSLNVENTPQEAPEYFAISALITGAVGQRPEITSSFGINTRLLDVTASGETLSVTLSDGFLLDTLGSSDEETRLNRRLAIYSIVNTVCEMGNHTLVQLYLEINGVRMRPDSFEMGITKTVGEGAPIGPLSRDTSLILSPSNVLKRGLTHYSNNEWSKLYLYLGNKDSAAQKLPILEEMTQQFQYRNLNMTEFTVEDNYTVSDDGKTALVQATFKIRTEYASYTASNVPIELVYTGRYWLISYASLLKHLEVAQ